MKHDLRGTSGKLVPDILPCGCASKRGVYKSGGPKIVLDVLALDDGSRICKHGKKWRVVWEEVR